MPRAPKPDDPEILRWFNATHLPKRLAEISEAFGTLAGICVDQLPNGAERQTALRKLLEAKDAAVRARLSENAP
jgi:hypothetical protein